MGRVKSSFLQREASGPMKRVFECGITPERDAHIYIEYIQYNICIYIYTIYMYINILYV